MASAGAVSIVRELGIRESGQSGSLALLGSGDHAATYPSGCAKIGLRHSTIRVTLDTYTQAVTTEKRNAQAAVVALLFREKTQET